MRGKKPGQDMRFKVHNGEGLYSYPDLVSSDILGGGGACSQVPRFLPTQILLTKDLRDLLNVC